MQASRLHAIVAIIFAMTGVFILAMALPNLAYSPFLFLNAGIEISGIGIFLGVIGPCLTISIAVFLIVQRSKLAQRLLRSHSTPNAPGRDIESNEFAAVEAEPETQQAEVAVADVLGEPEYDLRLEQAKTWTETIPKIALAVLGFYFIANGIVPVVSLLISTLIAPGGMDGFFAIASGVQWYSVLEGVIQVLIGFVLISQYERVIRIWHVVWGSAKDSRSERIDPPK
jgi:hypothetical protein